MANRKPAVTNPESSADELELLVTGTQRFWGVPCGILVTKDEVLYLVGPSRILVPLWAVVCLFFLFWPAGLFLLLHYRKSQPHVRETWNHLVNREVETLRDNRDCKVFPLRTVKRYRPWLPIFNSSKMTFRFFAGVGLKKRYIRIHDVNQEAEFCERVSDVLESRRNKQDNIVSKVESVILGMFFGFVPVLFCVAAAGFTNVLFLEEKGIGYWALGGLCVGLIIDVMFVKNWVKRAYQMNSKILAVLYIFYSIGVLGFCMGIPILEFPLGMAAGAYAARKIYHTKAGPEEFERSVKKMSIFAAAVMVLICCLMALWAIAGEMIGAYINLPGLSFTLTAPRFFAVVFTGGGVLVLLQYQLTGAAAKMTFRLSRPTTRPKG